MGLCLLLSTWSAFPWWQKFSAFRSGRWVKFPMNFLWNLPKWISYETCPRELGVFFESSGVEDQGHGCDFVLRHCLWCAWRCSKVYGRGDRVDRIVYWFHGSTRRVHKDIVTVAFQDQFPSWILWRSNIHCHTWLIVFFGGPENYRYYTVQPLQQQLSPTVFSHLSPKVGMMIKFPKSSSSLVHYSALSPKILYPANWI